MSLFQSAQDVLFGPRLRLVDPDGTEAFALDWSGWLGAASVETSDWEVTPEGPTLSGDVVGEGEDLGKTAVLVSGVEAGRIYRLTNRITTDDGVTADKSFTLRGAA